MRRTNVGKSMLSTALRGDGSTAAITLLAVQQQQQQHGNQRLFKRYCHVTSLLTGSGNNEAVSVVGGKPRSTGVGKTVGRMNTVGGTVGKTVGKTVGRIVGRTVGRASGGVACRADGEIVASGVGGAMGGAGLVRVGDVAGGVDGIIDGTVAGRVVAVTAGFGEGWKGVVVASGTDRKSVV